MNEQREVEIYTDGSFIKNKEGIKCGYGVHYPNKEYEDISKRFKIKPLTNQRAELYAIYKGIKQVSKENEMKDIIIYSDSEYSINSITKWIKKWKINEWKTANNKDVLNKDIIKKIDNLILNHKGKIRFIHVKSHTGLNDYNSIHNDIVDKLAKRGSEIS